ncbi:hypothetical protein NJB14197_16270 [Mycobacterium montefiorense]|uniref:Uncharacterized protein n=2 Tax=Mycobacterium montefiorense TaxID=154654 RepID=A0AA37UW54_9MYCO|nr:hypothetical protein [Mycobacterium montefiorense]GBG40857.1 hypothetical protein MmonteBS_52290 [Mycobacterium montefiorense]GKU33471.1 hypothetical protein NJB14191_08180 [Mycobacterium montefiorense]GKU39967.1 hypothetical protein NJB14192_19560 [Mycobacterium montefiorense]GKU45303.1 hypothetical protein NJB14194_19260 [Mycobacterium montefiorense]GKU49362.1 hypothetical protein NJB14195_06090 [Mycobacterium montefiorense]
MVLKIAAVFAFLMVSTVPQANAETPSQVPCGQLDRMIEHIDNEVSDGIGAVRIVIARDTGWLYTSDDRRQVRDAKVELARVDQGIHYVKDLNADSPIPGLAPLLDKLERASQNMNNAVQALITGHSDGPYLFTPKDSTWASIDYAEQKRNDVYGHVISFRGNCTP